MANRKSRSHNSYDFWEVLLSIILAAMMTSGLLMSFIPKSISLTGPAREHMTDVVLAFALFLVVFLYLIRRLFNRLDDSAINGQLVEKNTLIGSWVKTTLVILLCWLPYLVICYPGVTRGYDYFWQLLMGTGVFPLSNHHPVLSSLVIGALYKIGSAIGGPSFGLAFSMIFQSIALAASAGYSLSYICSENKVNKGAACLMQLLICFSPVFPGHAVFLVKDSLFTAAGMFFFTQCYMRINSFNKDRQSWVSSYLAIIISGCFFSLYRNGVVPITVAMFVMLLWAEFRYKDKKAGKLVSLLKWSAAFASFIAVVMVWNGLLSAWDVYPTNKREALAMPTRQIIRTIQLHPEELSGQTEEVLETAYWRQISLGYPLENIVTRYDDMNADAIKIDYVEKEDFLSDYIKLWVSLGLKHPGSYIDAALRGTDGYWYSAKHPHIESNGIWIHTVCTTSSDEDFANEGMRTKQFKTLFFPTVQSLTYKGIDTEQTFEDLFDEYPWLEELMNIKPPFPEGRKILGNVLAKMEDIPVLAMLLAPGLYCWIMMICLGYMFSRKKNGRFLWPVLMLEGVAWLSPANGYTRYVLLIEFYSILMIGMCFSKEKEEKQ